MTDRERCVHDGGMRLGPILVSLLVACSSSSPTPPPSASPPPSSAPPTTIAAPPTTITAAPAQLTIDQRHALATAIREGRRLAHDGDYAQALASFERAATIAPSSARVQCETAYVAFQAGDLARAETHLRPALLGLPHGEVPERSRVWTATCLYNAGLIHEARARLDDARAEYTRSIALRPNATVEARLDDLVRREVAVDVDAGDDADFESYDPTVSLDAIVIEVRDDFCAPGDPPSPDDAVCETSITRAITSGGAPIEAALIVASARAPQGGEHLHTSLVVRASGGAVAAVLADVDSPQIFGMYATTTATVVARDVLPGGGSEIVATVVAEADDSDAGTCDRYTSSSAATIVCSTDDGSLRCIAIPTDHSGGAEHTACPDAFDGDGDEITESDHDSHAYYGYTLAIRFDGGRAILTRPPGSQGPAVPPLIGDLPLADLLRRSDLTWPERWTVLSPEAG
jgi:hypothetical protein